MFGSSSDTGAVTVSEVASPPNSPPPSGATDAKSRLDRLETTLMMALKELQETRQELKSEEVPNSHGLEILMRATHAATLCGMCEAMRSEPLSCISRISCQP